MKHCGTQVLETKRLLLRPLTVLDAHEMFINWASDDKVTQYLTWHSHISVETVAKSLLAREKKYQTRRDFYDWGIVIKETQELIGTITLVNISDKDLQAELGYCLGRTWWRKGYMTEAGQAVIDFCFNHVGFHRIFATHDIDNRASACVLKKLGMSYEGRQRDVSFGLFVNCSG